MFKQLTKVLLPMMCAIACSSGSDSDLDESNASDRNDPNSSADTTDDPEAGEEAFGTTGATCPSTERPTYENFGQGFMDTYCTRCHSSAVTGIARNGATTNYDFDTLEGVIEHVEYIESVAASGPKATNTSMPPVSDGPAVELRVTLGQWLACLASGVETAD